MTNDPTNHRGLVLLLGVLLSGGGGVAAEPDASLGERLAAVRRSVPLIQGSAEEYLRQRDCFSCHHQTMSILALTAAKRGGVEVDERVVQRQVERTHAHLKGGLERYQAGKGQGGKADTAGFALWALRQAEVQPDDTTAAVAEYLLRVDAEQEDCWRREYPRPPSLQSDFATTYVAILGLRRYANADQAVAARRRAAGALEWARTAPVATTEDQVFRMRTLRLGASDTELSQQQSERAASELLRLQRDDGGWSQLPEGESDPYATATALAALADGGLADGGLDQAGPRAAGRLAPGEAAWERGVKYLLRTQQADGSWHVKTRSQPVQTYFESGFPHGKDQFISMTATCWAVCVLASRSGEGVSR